MGNINGATIRLESMISSISLVDELVSDATRNDAISAMQNRMDEGF